VLVKADTIGVSMPEVLVRRGTYACRRCRRSLGTHDVINYRSEDAIARVRNLGGWGSI
jgi:hypothetical protein